MKRKINGLVLTLALTATSSMASTNALEKIRGLNIFQQQNVQIKKIKDQGSLYQIKGIASGRNAFNAYITKDFKDVVFGKGFNTTTKKALTIPLDSQKYKKNAEYTFGTGKDEYILFTDPECPFCHKLEKILPLLKNHLKLYVYLFPLSFHRDSKQMCYYIMSQKKDSQKAKIMYDIATKNSTAYRNAKFSISELEQIKKKLAKEQSFGNEIGVRGTPSVYDMKGKSINWTTLLSKYNIQQPVDMDGVKFLLNNNLGISLNKSNKSPLYLFASLNDNQSINKIKAAIRKYSRRHALILFLEIPPQSKAKDSMLAIYSQKNNAARLKLLKKVLSGKSLGKKTLLQASSLSKDKETKYLPVSYIMQRMHVRSNTEVVILSKNGKLLK